MPLWNEIEGRTLGDGPEMGTALRTGLRTLLRSEGRTAWFAATDAEGQPAVVSVFETLNDEDAVQQRLEAAAAVKHPNLLAIRGVGSARLDDESLVYAVMEPFDQTLAEVLQERALTPDEARELAANLLSALEAVEQAGLRHGHVDAAGVLAVGDAIKLRSDCLSPSREQNDAPALAALLYNALTTRRFTSERDALQLPAPFATLVRAGAGTGGSLVAMRRVLNGPAVASAPGKQSAPAPAKPSATSPDAIAAGEAFPVAPPPVAPSPAAPAAPPPTAAARPTTPTPARGIPRAALARESGGRTRRPGVAIAATVLMLVLLIVFWLTFRHPAGPAPVTGQATGQATIAAAPPASNAPAPAPPNAAEQNAGAMGSGSSAQPAQPARARLAATPAPLPAAASPGEAVWHVVAYTYSRESTAKNKADELAAKYPKLEPQVFTPSGHAPYLVVLGGGMDRQDAMARRDAAREAGMPPDTYAQNFRK